MPFWLLGEALLVGPQVPFFGESLGLCLQNALQGQESEAELRHERLHHNRFLLACSCPSAGLQGPRDTARERSGNLPRARGGTEVSQLANPHEDQGTFC